MNRRRRARLATCVALTTLLSATQAVSAPLQVRLRIADACTLDAEVARDRCGSTHRRSDDEAPAPPQVQQLTPADEDDQDARRPWLTLTF
ncbi:TPA: hypothetical protein QDZ10_001161 [Stenotrophomonas maltophilia]|nr:hypothetical protein [Stenotrophomonas maltophilia]